MVVTIPTSGILLGTSTVATSTPEITLSNNTSSDSLVLSLTDISTTVALPANAQVGTTVTGSVTFTNLTNVATTITATISINGVPTIVSVFVPANSSAVVTVSVPVTTQGASLSANVGTSSVPDATAANNAASASLVPLIPDVSVTIDLPASAPAGSTVLATVTYTNVGSGSASTVMGTTTLSSGQIVPVQNLGSLAPGQSTVTTVIVTVPSLGHLAGHRHGGHQHARDHAEQQHQQRQPGA